MRKQRAPIEVFSLSFLDVISCAFGAVVMLILLAQNGDDGEFNDTSQISSILKALTKAEASVSSLQSAIDSQQILQQQSASESASNATEAEALESSIARAQRDLQQLTDKASGLENVKLMRERAAISVGKADERDEEVGGIPVDSDYVIFIIDTSGSMKSIWQKVMRKLDEVLEIHPQVKGFQIMSDNGQYLLKTTAGRWRSDTPASRSSVLKAMRSWRGSSNSSPVEGIQAALRTYGKTTDSLALYVFGDDYSGGSYDATLAQINKLNTHPKTKAKYARIHAIGFKQNGLGLTQELVKFSTLMREVAAQNNGTFIAQN
ncbi:hypothetical protein [Agaribacter marinus]|uniref:VWA domain-containing protein n=1 Tax=Agaribacter marinus TaxID=1431249 RepID=A0AA37SZ38_9ALTE|nr:hypothetical protein [Agaribacter marinus]GLR69233.1 hypothetical protein GCM10007852_01410 [Agaribacter marinus]